MARLAIRQVRYHGDNFVYESPPLSDGVCVLVGANGTGKTTFSDFIYFGLGGRVPKYDKKGEGRHVEVTADTNNYVELEIEVDGVPYMVRRHIGRNEIGVVAGDGVPQVFHVFRQHAVHDQGVFSDWLLDKLGIRPVTLFQGSRTWTLGFRDLARLIYHDQEPNPENVFRRPDQDGITESAYVRRAIFEILTGKSFQDLYDLHGEVRRLEEELAGLASQGRSFEAALRVFLDASSNQNVDHLKEIATTLQRELKSLEDERDVFVKIDTPEEDDADELAEQRQQLGKTSEQLAAISKTKRSLMRRIGQLEDGRITMLHETTAIEKILYTDKKTGLFSTDEVCPFCYSKIERNDGHCICGAAVSEGDFRAFFYSTDEYNELLREKRRALATIEASIKRSREHFEALSQKEQGALEAIAALERSIRSKRRGKSGQQRANQRLAQVEESIRSTERRLGEIHQRLKIERERERLIKERAGLEDRLRRKRGQVQVKEGQAIQEMADIRESFQTRYTELLRRLVPNVRTATMSETYDPIMNLGEYIEASARVPFRLLYFAVLLEMSLKDIRVPYPRFLLIDTPETAGIDPEKLLRALAAVQEISDSAETPHQIILTTGPGRYPATLESQVFTRLTEGNRLLQHNAGIPYTSTSAVLDEGE